VTLEVEVIKNQILSDVVNNSGSPVSVTPEMIKKIDLTEEKVSIEIEMGFPARSKHKMLCDQIVNSVKTIDDNIKTEIKIITNISTHSIQGNTQLIPGVKNIIAIASGKGGVGKSTTTVNLALALAAEGANVGVLDADIYGPSIPTMLGIKGKPESLDGKKFLPMLGHNLQANSIGFLVPKDQAMVWRGPMVTQALEQLLRQTAWDNLDYLLIDMPPGTGDIHLTLAQKVPLTGAIIVTTPQEIAVLDARKGLKMFEKVSVPIIGVIENMGVYVCPNCDNHEYLFGQGGGENLCDEHSTHFLGTLPLNIAIRKDVDSGNPTVVATPDSSITRIFKEVAIDLGFQIANMSKDVKSKFPKIVVKND
jgi:ATP-binding protein involved in chromosome partitioning